MRRSWSRGVLALGLAVPLALAGCRHAPRGAEGAEGAARALGEAESRGLIEAYNRRVAGLGTLWSRTTATLWFPGEDGVERSEQAEGHFNYRAPRGLVLTFGKVGQDGGVLGSNERGYWWAELREPKRALVGTHERASAEGLAQLGLPVHPLDVIDALGLSPAPADARAALAGGARTLTSPTRSGSRVLVFEGESAEPSRVVLSDALGRELLTAELADYADVAWRRAVPEAPPRVPTRVVITRADGRVRLRLLLSEPESGGSRRPSPAAFEPESWIGLRGITDVRDLDAEVRP